MPQSHSPGSGLMVAETGAQTGSAVTGIPGEVSSAAEGTAAAGGREDLTVFFTIGVIVDVLLVTVFLLWAVGQWRKTKR